MPRSRKVDACPGALQTHRAADGALARIRVPGGAVTAAQLQAIASASARFGAATLELTGRGNVQIRAVCDTAAFADAVAAAGLLPSPTHERVRNIVASPLAGRSGGRADVRGWVAELDAAVCADPALAQLPGRFWFSIDDGRGDVSGLGADVGVQVVDDEAAALLLAGRDTGVRLAPAETVAAVIAVASRFAQVRGDAWRVGELAAPWLLVAGATPGGAGAPAVTAPPVGWFEQDDGRVSLGAAVPLGVLPADVAECLAVIGAPLVVTPWRSVLVCDLDAGVAETAVRVLAPLGLVFDADSPWLRLSTCVGSPGCASAIADVRADAAAAVEHGDRGDDAVAVAVGEDDDGAPKRRHLVGCERACGAPVAGQVLVAAEGGGYRRLRPH